MHINFEENQKFIAFREQGIGNKELKNSKKVFWQIKYGMHPKIYFVFEYLNFLSIITYYLIEMYPYFLHQP